VFVSGLGWLTRSPFSTDDTEISRLLLADREAILVRSFTEAGRAVANTNRACSVTGLTTDWSRSFGG